MTEAKPLPLQPADELEWAKPSVSQEERRCMVGEEAGHECAQTLLELVLTMVQTSGVLDPESKGQGLFSAWDIGRGSERPTPLVQSVAMGIGSVRLRPGRRSQTTSATARKTGADSIPESFRQRLRRLRRCAWRTGPAASDAQPPIDSHYDCG